MTVLTFPGVALSSLATTAIGGPMRFSMCGDSIESDGFYSGAPTYLTNWGFASWFRRAMGRRIDFPNTRSYAVPGAKISDVVATQLPLAVADVSDVVIVHIGKNSISVETDATIQSEMQTIFDTLRAAGKTVIAIPVRACNSTSVWSAQQAKQVGKMTRFIYQYCRNNPNMLFFNFDPYLIDWTTGNAQATYLRDGVHDNLLSAKLLGNALANWLSPFIPLQDNGFVQLGDVYDATYNPTGNLLTNGLLAGSGGILANGATGTPPTSWRGRRGGNSGTTTLALSKVADGTYPTLSRAVLTIGGTGDGNNCILDNNNQTIAALGVSVGDVLELEAEIAWNFTTGAFGSIWLELDIMDSGFALLSSVSDGTASTANGVFPVGDSGSGFYRAPPLTVPAGASFGVVSVTCTPPASGACAGTVTVGRIALRKV